MLREGRVRDATEGGEEGGPDLHPRPTVRTSTTGLKGTNGEYRGMGSGTEAFSRETFILEEGNRNKLTW